MKKLGIWVALSAFAMNCYAGGFEQTINLCLKVTANTSPFSFWGHFASSDFFDHGTTIHGVTTGMDCKKHVYGHGPKKIALSVKVNGPYDQVLIIPGRDCPYVYNRRGLPGWVTSQYQHAQGPSESWILTLSQTDPVGMYKYVFNLDCERLAQPQ